MPKQAQTDNLKTKSDLNVTLPITIGKAVFAIDTSGGSTDITAAWEDDNLDDVLNIADITKFLGIEKDPGIPKEFDLDLQKASLTIADKGNGISTFYLGGTSGNWGSVQFWARKEVKENWKYCFCLSPKKLDLNIDHLPVVGELPEKFQIGLNGFKFTYLSDLNAAEITNFWVSFDTKPEDEIATSFSIYAKLKIGKTIRRLALELADVSPKEDESELESKKLLSIPLVSITDTTDHLEQAEEIPAEKKASPALYRSPALWISVQKGLGPLYIRKMGFVYDQGKTGLSFDGDIRVASLEMGFEGLQGTYNMNADSYESRIGFALSGLSLQFKEGPTQVSGGLLRVKEDEYTGNVVIKLGALAISAVGTFAKYGKDSEASLFVFTVIGYPLGGPPFFFVTGGSIGFGYNRGLVVPKFEDVPEFPLVKIARGKNKIGDFSDLNKDFPLELGQYWFSMGIKFTSCELVDGYGMMSIAMGNRFIISFLGNAELSVPKKVKEPVAYAEMGIVVYFAPDDGVIAIDAGLTSSAYILSKNCHLTGGFSFYIWFSGKHKGDFVTTLGGYHPRYDVPEHYPKQELLGINWQVDKHLYFKGGSYFALTSNALMAGGVMEAYWHLGLLKAWFIVNLDMLMQWKPLHYDFEIGIGIGVSMVINWFGIGKSTITASAGVRINIWGPKFSGKIKVKVSFISFTITWGTAASRMPAPLSWAEFKESFLPDKICTININDGLIKEIIGNRIVESVKEEVSIWVVNSESFVLSITSSIPSKTLSFNGVAIKKGIKYIKPKENNETELRVADSKNTETFEGFGEGFRCFTDEWNDDVEVGLVHVKEKDFNSGFEITITRSGELANYSQYLTVSNIIEANVPASLWNDGEFSLSDNEEESFVNNTLKGVRITAAPKSPGFTLPVYLRNLLYQISFEKEVIQYSSPIPPSSNYNRDEQVESHGKIKDTILNTEVSSERCDIINALSDYELNLDTEIDLRYLKQVSVDYWEEQPILSELGEEYEFKNTL